MVLKSLLKVPALWTPHQRSDLFMLGLDPRIDLLGIDAVAASCLLYLCSLPLGHRMSVSIFWKVLVLGTKVTKCFNILFYLHIIYTHFPLSSTLFQPSHQVLLWKRTTQHLFTVYGICRCYIIIFFILYSYTYNS